MSLEAIVRKMAKDISDLRGENSTLRTAVTELMKRPRTISEEIDSIPGRRITYTLSGEQTFTVAANNRLRSNPINMLVSQDGQFVMTHYPVAVWYPSSPSNATNLNRFMPVMTWPTPSQQTANEDVIDISYELVDGGSQRNFQNLTASPAMLSRPGDLIPLPVPTLFAPNTTIQVIPTYLNIFFSTGTATNTTGGTLHIDLPGYRIVNL